MTVLEIIGMAQSTYVRATRMALEEKGVPYTLISAMPQSPQMLALHPYGKIPAMRHGDFTLFESRAIIAYADRVFDGPPLVSADARTAARAEQWISAINTSAFPALFPYMREHAFPSGPDGSRNEAAVAAALPAVQRHVAILDTAVSGSDWLAGDAFTLADMYVSPILAYLRLFPESGAMMRDSVPLSRYFARCAERPSFVATTPPPMSELRN